MSQQEQAGEKSEPATPKKRQDARKKGTVAKSTEINGAAGLFLVAIFIPWVIRKTTEMVQWVFGTRLGTIPSEISPNAAGSFVISILAPLAGAVAPIIFGILVLGVVVNFAQVGFVLSPEALKPKWEKLNPINGLKRLFSMRSAVEGAKAIFKLGVFSFIAYTTIRAQWDQLLSLALYDSMTSAAFFGALMRQLLTRIAIAWLLMALADYMYQRWQTEKDLRMTRYELKKEMKEMEGSPEVKNAQYQRRRQMSKGSLAKQLKAADVVLMNPTHYAVALKYDRSSMFAPQVLAKGQDFLALRIRDMAKEMGIAVVQNPPLARRLHKECEIGDFIPRDLFAAVAEVLAFVYQQADATRKRA